MAKIAIMGAGAVGCYYGALLALAGHEVCLIGRPALVEAVTQRGLLFETSEGKQSIKISAALGAEAIAGVDIVLVCVKSPDTKAAGLQMRPHLSPDTAVLSLQNGISNAETLSDILGQEVIPVVVYAAVEMAGVGHVRHKGRGELILGSGARAEVAAQILADSGVKLEVSDQAQAALWTKFIVNCVVNGISALSRQPYGVIAAQEGAEALMKGLMEECLALAKAEGIAMPHNFWLNIQGIITGMPQQYSSTAQDVLRGKISEIDQLNGEVVARAKRYDLAVPFNNAVWVLTRLAQESSALK